VIGLHPCREADFLGPVSESLYTKHSFVLTRGVGPEIAGARDVHYCAVPRRGRAGIPAVGEKFGVATAGVPLYS
jgi:hypothetical protein